ncbi:hypothetical protein ACTXT7_009944 [Hymenolepis weldensis]
MLIYLSPFVKTEKFLNAESQRLGNDKMDSFIESAAPSDSVKFCHFPELDSSPFPLFIISSLPPPNLSLPLLSPLALSRITDG